MRIHRTLYLFAATAAIAAAVFVFVPDLVARISYALEAGKAEGAREALGGVEDLSLAFKRAAKAVRPSVVSVSSVKIVRGDDGDVSRPESPFRDYFGGDPFERFFRRSVPQEGFKQSGLGSGVIVSKDGHILTNNHVVAGVDEITVRLSDGREKTAKVIGTDPKTDVAVIKIDAGDLYAATLGDASVLEAGEWVLAVGSPFGLNQTLTAGIVSATGRANVGIVDYEDFIQTDAAINPGNSGGPLVNLKGEVVGLNTAIFSRSGGYMGIGFAIPINMARSVMESLLADGKVTRGFLGVQIQDLNEKLARSFGYSGTQGALVNQVVPGGPSAAAGLQEGDIITGLDGKAVANVNDLRTRVASLRPSTRVEVDVVREGAARKLELVLGELPSAPLAAAGGGSGQDLGMTLRTLTPDVASELRVDADLRGVAVLAVRPGSPADKAGLEPRDVILSVQGRAVDSAEALRRELARADLKADGVRLKVARGDAKLYLLLEGG